MFVLPPGHVCVPARGVGDVRHCEEDWETVSPGCKSAGSSEDVHDEREGLGVDVGGEGVLPEGEGVLLADGQAVVRGLCACPLPTHIYKSQTEIAKNNFEYLILISYFLVSILVTSDQIYR